MQLKTVLRRKFRSLTGYDIHKYVDDFVDLQYRDAFTDIGSRIDRSDPIIFDVGANRGQTIEKLTSVFPKAHIHAFEPGRVFDVLSQQSWPNGIKLNNVALGAAEGTIDFYEHTSSKHSSPLPLNRAGFRGGTTVQCTVPVSTIDACSARNNVLHIDLLKMDVQGYEMNVLRGAEKMLPAVGLIYLEITFAKIYKHAATLDELYSFLTNRGFKLVTFYNFHYLDEVAGWTNALFINSVLNRRIT